MVLHSPLDQWTAAVVLVREWLSLSTSSPLFGAIAVSARPLGPRFPAASAVAAGAGWHPNYHPWRRGLLDHRPASLPPAPLPSVLLLSAVDGDDHPGRPGDAVAAGRLSCRRAPTVSCIVHLSPLAAASTAACPPRRSTGTTTFPVVRSAPSRHGGGGRDIGWQSPVHSARVRRDTVVLVIRSHSGTVSHRLLAHVARGSESSWEDWSRGTLRMKRSASDARVRYKETE